MWILPLKDILRPFELLNQKLASGGVSKLWFSVVKRGAEKKGRVGPFASGQSEVNIVVFWLIAYMISPVGNLLQLSLKNKFIDLDTRSIKTNKQTNTLASPKFCIAFVFHFSCVLQSSQEKIKTLERFRKKFTVNGKNFTLYFEVKKYLLIP